VAARAALGDEKLKLYGVNRLDSATRMVLGGREMGLFTNGEWVRLVVTGTGADTGMVRVLSRSGYALDLRHSSRAPYVLRQLDARLDPAAVLVAGNRVRAQLGPRAVTGELALIDRDSLRLQSAMDAAGTPLALADVTRLSIHRGSRRHTREVALAGALAGAIVGLVLSNESAQDQWLGDLHRLIGLQLGMLAGFVVGAGVGSQVRTDIWSDLDMARLR
jgi:hypothetical protein